MTEASHYIQLDGQNVQCLLCPHHCTIRNGKEGICRVRKNDEGMLKSENYGKLSAIHLDPIEKKPLYHFMPGSYVLSVGSVGCNMQCSFCQNCEISQSSVDQYPGLKNYRAQELLQLAIQTAGNIGLAYTYNEPTVFYEFMLEMAQLAREQKLKNVVVSNGFISEKPLQDLLEYADAFNIDLKSFDQSFYAKYAHASLEPVKKSMMQVKKAGKHLEITNLLIPGLNDNESVFREMIRWIDGELGSDTVFHLSRYFPRYKLTVESTPLSLLEKMYSIAARQLTFVYVGNIRENRWQDTYCPGCRACVVARDGYQVNRRGLTPEGTCSHCGTKIMTMG